MAIISPVCLFGGGGARRVSSFGRIRSYLLPWRLTRQTATPPPTMLRYRLSASHTHTGYTVARSLAASRRGPTPPSGKRALPLASVRMHALYESQCVDGPPTECRKQKKKKRIKMPYYTRLKYTEGAVYFIFFCFDERGVLLLTAFTFTAIV